MNEPDPDDPWLTLNEIAEELRMSPATIRSWVSRGTLKATRPGRRKWLVRRSELDRLLRADEASDPDQPIGDAIRTTDTIGPPHRSPYWPAATVEHVTRGGWLGVAESEWRDALRSSAMAPPDPYLVLRLRRIAEAAARKAAALTNLESEEPAEWWRRQSALPDGVLSYELRPGGNRPGPGELWAELDQAVETLGVAMSEHSITAEITALEKVSLALHEIADALQEGSYPWADDRRRGDPEIHEIPKMSDDDAKSGRELGDTPDTRGQQK